MQTTGTHYNPCNTCCIRNCESCFYNQNIVNKTSWIPNTSTYIFPTPLTKEEVRQVIREELKDYTENVLIKALEDDSTSGLSFGQAFEHVLNGKGMRLPHWKPDVVIRAQFPDENSKMTHPYLYAESVREGEIRRVPWRETFPEMFSKEWIVVD